MLDNFAIFICTHGRPHAQHTLKMLQKYNYTGKYYLVLDDQDSTIQEYIDEYGTKNIVVFDKNYYVAHTDCGTDNPPFQCIVYAKNAVEDLAVDLGLESFVITDDDILDLRFRYVDGTHCRSTKVTYNIDSILDAYNDLMLLSNMSTLSFGFNSLYFCGANLYADANVSKMRGAYNFIFRNASIPVNWKASFGEDIVSEILYSHIGQLWCVAPQVQFGMIALTSADGGMKDVYDKYKSGLMSYYIEFAPNSVKITDYNGTLKATVKVDNTYPKIINERYKK